MVKVGLGFRPVLPFRGWGAAGRQPDALLAPDERLGILFKTLCLAPLLYTCFILWHTGANGGLSVGVGLRAYHFLKCSQIPRYGFNSGSHARLWPGSAARNARDARFRDRFSASLAALASLVPRSEPPPAAGRCFGSCGRSVPVPGGYPSRDSSSASAASAPWRCLRRC